MLEQGDSFLAPNKDYSDFLLYQEDFFLGFQFNYEDLNTSYRKQVPSLTCVTKLNYKTKNVYVAVFARSLGFWSLLSVEYWMPTKKKKFHVKTKLEEREKESGLVWRSREGTSRYCGRCLKVCIFCVRVFCEYENERERERERWFYFWQTALCRGVREKLPRFSRVPPILCFSCSLSLSLSQSYHLICLSSKF